MRKFYSLIIAAALTASLSSSASVGFNNQIAALKNVPRATVKNIEKRLQGKSMQQTLDAKTPLAQNAKRVKASPKAAKQLAEDASPEYITETPQGEQQIFYRNSFGFSYSYWGVYYAQDYGSVGEVVFGENNDVYLKNPFSGLATGTYLKGTIDGDVITVKFPQPIYQESYYGSTYDYYAAKLTYSYVEGDTEDDSYATFEAGDDQEMQFKYADGKITQLGDNQDEEIIGLVYIYDLGDDDEEISWIGYGDTEYEYLPFEDELVTVPESATVSEKALIYTDGGGSLINVAKDGSDVYFQGLNNDYPDGWVKGSLADGKVTIPSWQYIGISDEYNHFAYFVGGDETVTYFDEDYSYSYYEAADQLELTYDADTDTYTAGEEHNAALANLGKEEEYFESGYFIQVIRAQGDISESTPADPVITYYEEYDPDWEYGCLQFNFPSTDTDGNVLPTSKLFYNFLVDGDPYTLYPDEYYGLTYDELTDIPYGYADDWYDLYATGASHVIYYYFEGAESIGVQTIYRPAEGKEYRSNPVVVNFASVKSLESDSKQVANETYFDLTGRIVANPANGLVIKKIKYTDGTTKVEKVIKK